MILLWKYNLKWKIVIQSISQSLKVFHHLQNKRKKPNKTLFRKNDLLFFLNVMIFTSVQRRILERN